MRSSSSKTARWFLPLAKLRGSSTLYVGMDWASSVLSFLFFASVYRFSEAGADLGENAWLLSLIGTAIFVSMATSVYTMMVKVSAVRSFLTFLPVVLAVDAVMFTLLPLIQWVWLVSILVLNLFYSSFKGELLARGFLLEASVANFLEQGLRVAALILLTVGYEIPIAEAMLQSMLAVNALAAIVCLIASLCSSYQPLRKPDFKEALPYAFTFLAVYAMTSADLLVLQAAPDSRAEFATMKPWGTGLYTLTVPLIQIYLLRWGAGDSIKPVVRMGALLYVGTFTGLLLLGEQLNLWVFNKPLPSVAATIWVLVEHGGIALLSVLFYRQLQVRYAWVWMLVVSFLLFAFMAATTLYVRREWLEVGFAVISMTACLATVAGQRIIKTISARKGERQSNGHI